MPYGKTAKLRAKKFISEVRLRTVCDRCGAQPVEWHHVDHEADENQRVAHLVALGFPVKRIQQEIDKCEALCRSCHMKEDGRLKALSKNKPFQKGVVAVGPKPCAKCAKLTKPSWRGMCRSCYDFKRRGK